MKTYKRVEDVVVGDHISTPTQSSPSFTFTVRRIERDNGKLCFYTDGLEWPIRVLPGMEVEVMEIG